MNDQQQRIAIAEACGWKYTSVPADGGCYGWQSPEGGNLLSVACLPNYLHDLNVMHEVEKSLDNINARFYIMYIHEITKCFQQANDITIKFIIAHATAAERAEAFLRTIGKWKD